MRELTNVRVFQCWSEIGEHEFVLVRIRVSGIEHYVIEWNHLIAIKKSLNQPEGEIIEGPLRSGRKSSVHHGHTWSEPIQQHMW